MPDMISVTDPFDDAIKFVLEQEGGYVYDPNDPGGATNRGISFRFLRGVDGYEGIDKDFILGLSEKETKKIYRSHFWTALRLDEIPPGLSVVVFDTSVNMGPRVAVKLLQKSINQFNNDNFVLKVDGKIGEKTIDATYKLSSCDERPAVTAYLLNRVFEYQRICRGNHKLRRYLTGWLNRVESLFELRGGI